MLTRAESARVNGSKSRGPVTGAGKAISSRNALRHGLTASQLALANEDQASLLTIINDYMDEYLPQGPTETNLVENMAYAKWCEYRAWITETGLYNAEMAANVEKMNEKFVRFDESARTADALESSLKRSGSLPHLLRCQTRSNREYYKALATLLALRKAPRAAPKASKNTSEIAETNPAPPPETLQTRDNQVTPASGTRQSPASPLAQTVTPQAPHPASLATPRPSPAQPPHAENFHANP